MKKNNNLKKIINKANSQFPGVGPIVGKVFEDSPVYQRNVFIMMRFKSTPQFEEITRTLRSNLRTYGLWGLRADDRAYSDDLWLNVCGYMWACKYGIAIFEDIDERDFNPNIALECGFMMALGKRVLLLKESRMPKMPTDITGKLWKPFSVFNIESTISQQIESWVKDIGLTPIESKQVQYIPPIELVPMLKQAIMQEVDNVRSKIENPVAKKELENLASELNGLDADSSPLEAYKSLERIHFRIRYLRPQDESERVKRLMAASAAW